MDNFFVIPILYTVFIGGVFVFGYWAYAKGVSVKWYELLSVVTGSLLGLMTCVYVLNYLSAVWLILLMPALALILFGWWCVTGRYKTSNRT
ncbi:MAG: hypothetical protein WCS74_00295 [Dehalococcoidales bacterium]|jgi:uncharacterized membrane protein YfcA|nr:hypothetical protein [Dehalococcoidales bacterium]MDD3264360.1 hypothetical protein [Dehalococcoidales bacterium]MDD4322126.1 hypothetical protein [Dehalococcoidales bacterium]MDD4793696.1 hypothetical protein [Dehalococcoidales bacterium]MDD5122016.1 hypothetical protein [Dehalococcoidales bacterium]